MFGLRGFGLDPFTTGGSGLLIADGAATAAGSAVALGIATGSAGASGAAAALAVAGGWGVAVESNVSLAVWNPADAAAGISFSNGNLTVASTSGANQNVRSNVGRASGRWRFEATMVGTTKVAIGVANATKSLTEGAFATTNSIGYYSDGGVGYNGGAVATYDTYTHGDVITVDFDVDAGKVWFWKNGVCQNGDPDAGTGGIAIASGSPLYAFFCAEPVGASATANFGTSRFVAPPNSFKALGAAAAISLSVATGSAGASGAAVPDNTSVAAGAAQAGGSALPLFFAYGAAVATGSAASLSLGTGSAAASGAAARLSVAAGAATGSGAAIGLSVASGAASAAGAASPAAGAAIASGSAVSSGLAASMAVARGAAQAGGAAVVLAVAAGAAASQGTATRTPRRYPLKGIPQASPLEGAANVYPITSAQARPLNARQQYPLAGQVQHYPLGEAA